MLLGEFKQEIIRINNKVNIEVFGQGLKSQRVEVFHDKVLIIANNTRVKVLYLVDRTDNFTTKIMDIALIMEFKDRFIAALNECLGITALAHLKDYDPKTEISVSVTILDRPVEELLPIIEVKK
jgi:uncharacterized protein YbcI